MQKPGYLERIFEAKQQDPEVMVRMSEEAWNAYAGYLKDALDSFGEDEATFVRDAVLGGRSKGGWHDSSLSRFSIFRAGDTVGAELDVEGDSGTARVIYEDLVDWEFPGGERLYMIDRHELVKVGDVYQHTVYFVYPREPLRILAGSIRLDQVAPSSR
ncbi:hypothetical protein [Pseudoxanthomonas sp. z9]|uniref:hypothetical protein n=1 Tax=Pseudoxanthomonas sp. z9 TaxID=2584942 RepID=UPI0011438453|nr:hypothetical protein [Pseudoxanthomonas sp. z9]